MRQDFTGQKIVVVGAGRTGVALSAYFADRGAHVTLSDQRSADRITGIEDLPRAAVQFDFGGHDAAAFRTADLIAVSPGVPLTVPAIAEAEAAGVPVIGEIEVAFNELDAPLVAIAGTNGKSTTTTVMGEAFQAWGKQTFVGGNLGTPLVEAVQEAWDWVVAEVSSFQLEAIRRFRPKYALLLNITEDHLDRYPDMDSYIAAKARVFENQSAEDVAVLNAEDTRVLDLAKGLKARKVFFSSARVLDEGMGFDGSDIVWRVDGKEQRFAVAQMHLKGLHNVENVMAALIPPLMEGCPAEIAWRSTCAFTGLAHRMVPVRVLDGVTWYDDSKGTNVGSVVKSLAGLPSPVTLIAGGKDKGGDYAPLADLVKQKVAHLLLIGQAAERMAASLGGLTHTVRAESLEEAVLRARDLTPAGGTVLLSPGCSSYDMFSSYIERGERFAKAVLELPEKKAD